MGEEITQYILYFLILIVLSFPLGLYIGKVMNGEKTFLTYVCLPIEKLIYKFLKVKINDEMNWKTYLYSIIWFSFLFVLQLIQGFLFGNFQNLDEISWDLAFNTAISFVTNTNWQSYSGEAALTYLTQALGLTVQNFLSASVGIAVLFAIIRGFNNIKTDKIGNFWVDLTRINIHILIPINLIISMCLVAGGVVQTLKPAEKVNLVEPVAITQEGEIIENAVIDIDSNRVTVDGEQIENAVIVTEQIVPLGPVASQVAIKQSGTNGGGFYGTNSAHPLENPNSFTNLIEMISILLIPSALCFTFGRNIKNKKQGIALFMVMFICLVLALVVVAVNEHMATPQLAQNGNVDLSMLNQAGGNMEGKESRFGIVSSSVWATFTTAASSGSVNSMHDSYTPLGGMMLMLLMQLGEVIFGGVGSGLYGMISFVVLTVFIAGLMVGRTPELLGKKIEPYEMKWAVIVCLATPIAILVGSGIGVLVPSVREALNNSGAHGFSEISYAFTSAGANNGSSFAGLSTDTVFFNISLGISMLFARFVPIIGTLAIAGSLSKKKKIATTSGTLSTTNSMFVVLLIIVILLIGALSFLPALALGPIAEYLNSII